MKRLCWDFRKMDLVVGYESGIVKRWLCDNEKEEENEDD
jgi:hypothetical protein